MTANCSCHDHLCNVYMLCTAPQANAINFALIPPSQRILYVNVLAVRLMCDV